MLKAVIKIPMVLGWDSKGMHSKKFKKKPEDGPEKVKDLKLAEDGLRLPGTWQ